MSKVAVIGLGFVGATIAQVIVQSGVAKELILIDKNQNKAISEVLDIKDGLSFLSTSTKVTAGTYEDVTDCDVVISALGNVALAVASDDRFAELKANIPAVKSVAKELKRVGFAGKLLVVTNPNDAMTGLFFNEMNLPASHVIGTGTVLDTARMRHYVGDALGIDGRSVNGYVIGEHGASQVVMWSSVFIGGKSIFDIAKTTPVDLKLLAKKTREGGFHVVAGKGYTNVAIAEATVHILEAIVNDAKRVLTVSHYNENEGIYISTPAVVGKNGIEDVVYINLTEKEQKLFDESIEAIKEKGGFLV